jgi:UDP-N-acetylglucosamine--N-acetylmuramyl-(pentapeptide) pyrophosphoryl-undecaprenol N-acetylglucosamine transferase
VATLAIATAGGHLQELRELLPRITPLDCDDVTWVTFDTAQARSLLAGQQVLYVPYTPPRSLRRVLSNAFAATGVLRRHRYRYALSTGSGVAVSFLPMALLSGSSCHYIESATRVVGPSLTGKILERIPGINLYTQSESWAGRRWHFRGSVFDSYQPASREHVATSPRKIVVATGSSAIYGFRALIERLVEIIPSDVEVLWQTGSTDVTGLAINPQPELPSQELSLAFAEADVVIAHAGVGTALLALSQGHCPILVPRRRVRGEHIDDHQLQIAEMLGARDLALSAEVEDLDYPLLLKAAARRVVRVGGRPPFQLVKDHR